MPRTAPLCSRKFSMLIYPLVALVLGLNTALPAKDIVEPIAPDDAPLPNPFKGFLTEVDVCYETTAVPQTLAIRTITWAELEPEREKIDFAALEKDWAPHLKLGRRIAIRIRTADPFSQTAVDIPQWVVDKGVKMRPYNLDGSEGQAPDWNNPQFQDAHAHLIKRLGQKYNADPRIAWIDIGTYGFWGEWHVYKHPELAADDDHKRYILDSYLRAFPAKKLCLPYMDNYAARYAVDRGAGLRNNYIGSPADNQAFIDALTRVDPDLPETLFQTAYLGGDFAGGDDGARATLASEELSQATLALIEKTHLSFLGPTGSSLLAKPGDATARLQAIHKKLGYRFSFTQFTHPDQVRIGQTLSCSLVLKNEGVTAFPYPWRVSLLFTSTDTDFTHEMTPTGLDWDIRRWIPGTWTLPLVVQYTRSDRFQPGDYTVWIAILDPATERPGVAFAQTGRAPDGSPAAGYYKLGTVKVVK